MSEIQATNLPKPCLPAFWFPPAWHSMHTESKTFLSFCWWNQTIPPYPVLFRLNDPQSVSFLHVLHVLMQKKRDSPLDCLVIKIFSASFCRRSSKNFLSSSSFSRSWRKVGRGGSAWFLTAYMKRQVSVEMPCSIKCIPDDEIPLLCKCPDLWAPWRDCQMDL